MKTKEKIKAEIASLKKQLVIEETQADTLKICLNGSFGKLGSRYSTLYAPELLLQTTLTGQFCLLMLIERMENAGIKIVSANTDGIVCKAPSDLERKMEEVAWEWMLDTSFALERTDYTLLASRDVNSYVAIKANGKIKRKGCFNLGGLMKNADRNIVYTAVVEFLKHGIPLKETIMDCKDPGQFVSVRKVSGGAMWDGEVLGTAVRYYSTTDSLFVDPALHYVLNGNRVPKSGGCMPLMEMDGELPKNVNHDAYISDANKLLVEVGYQTH